MQYFVREREELTYPASGNETDFLSRNGRAGNSGGFPDVLVVTTSVRMVDRVHGHTTSTRPAVIISQSERMSHFPRNNAN